MFTFELKNDNVYNTYSMALISSIIFYIIIFLIVYVQVFFLVTFFENRKKIITRKGTLKLNNYPRVTVIVPGYNEEKTIYKTVQSLLSLNYPKDKINIILVDDGSTDGTLQIMEGFTTYSNIKVFHKENGGKHTALNLGLLQTTTDFVGCLDADSFVHKEALVRIMSYFEQDPSTMAVTPSLVVHNSKNIIQHAQKIEYHMSVYFKKMLGFLGGIHVTPGPLTIFRKKVFNDLGHYHQAHNTEDMEIAYRMQKNHYKIEHCNDAYVYTNTPLTVKKLYKQRLRWIYGFINNSIDYKNILLKRQYGNFSFFTIPSGIISIFAASFLFGKVVYNLGDFLYSKIIQFHTVGFNFLNPFNNFDLFFLNTQSFIFLIIMIYILVIFSTVIGRNLAEGTWGVSFHVVYFFSIFSIIAPFWLMRAIYNTAISKKPSWR